MQFKKEYNVFYSAHTLSTDCIGKNESGWTISGEIKRDYDEWVNEFEAIHSKYGKVWGDFEKTVFADSEEGFNHFIENHKPEEWDYQDI
ncbi:MAG: hypothetical protein GY849_00720 [Deltaproteobacteria bacterium]|nr:hypothetical protein [Deltaproteobacteria bacterium]